MRGRESVLPHLRGPAMVGIFLCAAAAVQASMQITEWMYKGHGGEFAEFTNTGDTPIDMAGWSYDDDSGVPGTIDLSPFGTVQPGESVIITEDDPPTFRSDWGLPVTVGVVSINGTANLGRNDTINLYNASNGLIDALSYGDEDYPGSPRARCRSCNIPAGDYGDTVAQPDWVLAIDGDIYGSWQSSNADVASPGQIPEPASLLLLIIAGAAALLVRHP